VLAVYLREYDAALDLLEPALAQGKVTLIRNAAVDPDLDSLRGNPRFDAMLAAAQERLGINPDDQA
jgi:hypothetical protein